MTDTPSGSAPAPRAPGTPPCAPGRVGGVDESDNKPITQEAEYEAAIQRNFRWNFAVNLADGALFWLGLSFAAPSTIMPLYVSHLTDSRLLIGLISAITGAGWYLPQLLMANYVERMPVKKKLVIGVGLFSERLPFIVMAASVFLFAARDPKLALGLFFLTLTWHTIGAGVVAISWQDMLAKVIPVNYRGRLLGLANALGAAAGIAGAAAAAVILARYPFPTNFAVCISLLAIFVLGSWFALSLTREPPLQSNKPAISLREYLLRLPAVLRSDRNFAAYLLSRVAAVFGRMAIGFVTVYAVQRWDLSDAQAGFYTTLLLVGEAVAYVGVGALADRRGHKVVQETSLVLSALSMAIAVLAPSPTWIYAVFAAIGALTAADVVSTIGIAMEFGTPEERPTYLGLANTIPGLPSAVAPLLGGWIASRTNYAVLFVTALLLSAVAWAILHWLVQEPRKTVASG
jgi:MFS family permease